MTHSLNFLSIDLGASSGRVLLARWDGARFVLQELHRFPNGAVNVVGHLQWDVLRLWSEIKEGVARYAAQFNEPLAGIGVDTWGVDFALLDRAGHLLGNPYCYRDSRTDGMMEKVFQRASRAEIFSQTGLQFMPINTLFQLYSLVDAHDPLLDIADTMLLTPDLFHYWLTGRQVAEYTIASTTQMLHCGSRTWATSLLNRVGIPARLLPPLIQPGNLIGELRGEIIRETNLKNAAPIIAVGSHDTASAVVAVPSLDEHSAYISSGTWSLVGVEIAEPILNERALRLNFTNEGGVNNTIRLLKNVAGLWLLQECKRHWGDAGWDEVIAHAREAAPLKSLIDPDAADFLHPADMPEAIRSYCRRVGEPEPDSVGALARCCLESLALKYRWVIESLESLIGREIKMICIVGGGSQNKLLCQFTADATQRVVVAGPVEATALGNALVQAMALKQIESLAQARVAALASSSTEIFTPQQNEKGKWDEGYGRLEWM
ncbi:MAG: rhamnulokinase [Chloroflexi bacterium]|nr:rhamnulokinase [Chloroflexota bacterium]